MDVLARLDATVGECPLYHPADDPGSAEAGAVFVVDPGVTGPLPTPFRRARS